jgi:hypothetical protein
MLVVVAVVEQEVIQPLGVLAVLVVVALVNHLPLVQRQLLILVAAAAAAVTL